MIEADAWWPPICSLDCEAMCDFLHVHSLQRQGPCGDGLVRGADKMSERGCCAPGLLETSARCSLLRRCQPEAWFGFMVINSII